MLPIEGTFVRKPLELLKCFEDGCTVGSGWDQHRFGVTRSGYRPGQLVASGGAHVELSDVAGNDDIAIESITVKFTNGDGFSLTRTDLLSIDYKESRGMMFHATMVEFKSSEGAFRLAVGLEPISRRAESLRRSAK